MKRVAAAVGLVALAQLAVVAEVRGDGEVPAVREEVVEEEEEGTGNVVAAAVLADGIVVAAVVVVEGEEEVFVVVVAGKVVGMVGMVVAAVAKTLVAVGIAVVEWEGIVGAVVEVDDQTVVPVEWVVALLCEQ